VGLLALAMFSVGLRSYFAIDDFYWLFEAKYTLVGVASLWHILVSNTGPMYRPLGQDLFFSLGWHLFGMNPAGYLAISILAIAISATYLFRIYWQLSSWGPACVATAMAAFTSSHFELATWASSFAEVGACTAFIIAIFQFIQGSSKWCGIWFVLALLCNETATPLPAVALAISYFILRDALNVSLKRTRPLWIIFALYALFRLFVTGLSSARSGPFAFTVDFSVYVHLALQSFANAFGWFPTFNNVLHSGGVLGLAAQVIWILYLLIVAAVTVIALLGDRRDVALRFIAAGLVWFIATLAPLLLFSANNWSLYNLALPIAGIGLAMAGIFQAASETPLLRGAFGRQRVAIAAASLQFGINALALYGPGGWQQTDGIAQLEKQSRAFYAELERQVTEEGRRNFHVNISSSDVEYARTIAHGNLLVALVSGDPNTRVLFTETPTTDPTYTRFMFDRQTAAYTLLSTGTATVPATAGARGSTLNSLLRARIVSVDKNADPRRAVVHLTWIASKWQSVEVHMNAPDGPVFVATAGGGEADTGDWVISSTRFFLQDVTGGGSRTLSVLDAPKF